MIAEMKREWCPYGTLAPAKKVLTSPKKDGIINKKGEKEWTLLREKQQKIILHGI